MPRSGALDVDVHALARQWKFSERAVLRDVHPFARDLDTGDLVVDAFDEAANGLDVLGGHQTTTAWKLAKIGPVRGISWARAGPAGAGDAFVAPADARLEGVRCIDDDGGGIELAVAAADLTAG